MLSMLNGACCRRRVAFAFTCLLIGLAALPAAAQEQGVLCRFTGQDGPDGDPTETWNSRWMLGPGIRGINDDCEAVIGVEKFADGQWVGQPVPPRLSYLRTRAEVGIAPGFVMSPGDSFRFMEMKGKHLVEEASPHYAVRVGLSRAPDAGPDEYMVRLAWVADTDEGVIDNGPYVLTGPERLLIRVDWESSTDSDGDFVPDADGFVRLYVNDEVVCHRQNLVIDQISISEIRYGYVKGADAGTFGDIYLRPLGIDNGYFER